MKKKLRVFGTIVLGLYALLCAALYFFQEKIIFIPQQLPKSHVFHFSQEFEELNFKTKEGIRLNGLLFKAQEAKGLIFYLHGNAGSLDTWGNVAKLYTDLGYDVFMLDYRGYGKSEGNITSPEQLFRDNQLVYSELKKRYQEEEITILGYSIGTGLATKLASINQPKQLILQAPYYSLTDMMRQQFSFIPTFILKYKFPIHEYFLLCEMPITIFHGDRDGIIPYESSVRLKQEFSDQVTLITLKGQGHNGMTNNPDYQRELKRILMQ